MSYAHLFCIRGPLFAAFVLLIGLQFTSAGEEGNSAAPATSQSAKDTEAKNTSAAATGVSPNVAQVLKLMDAGVSKEIIKTFAENMPTLPRLSTADLIALKQGAVPDEITAALMKRGAESSAEEANRPVAAPAIVNYLSSGGQMDPDSYDFFFYHYAYPRALSYSYDRLARYQPGYYYPYPGAYPGVVSYPSYGVPYYGLSDRYRTSRSAYSSPSRINRLSTSSFSRSRGASFSSRNSNSRFANGR